MEGLTSPAKEVTPGSGSTIHPTSGRDCPKSLGCACNEALRATETVLLDPFWPPCTGQIHARSVPSTLFGQSQKECSRKFSLHARAALLPCPFATRARSLSPPKLPRTRCSRSPHGR